MTDKCGPNRVVAHVLPFLVVTLARTEASVPLIGLPLLRRIEPFPSESGLPIGNPIFQVDVQRTRSCKHVDMIRHENITANQPRARLSPFVD